MDTVTYVQIGVDIGQKVDPTAIVVAELSQRATGRMVPGWRYNQYAVDEHEAQDSVYTVRLIERLPLGTAYPDVARRIVAILVNMVQRRQVGTPRLERDLYVDATGVGQPVVDILRESLNATPQAQDCRIYALTFTNSDKYDRDAGRLGKAHLVSRLQALMQTQCVKLPPNNPEAQVMARELKDYEMKVSQDGADTYGAFKVGTHDDLATALGLACLEDPYKYLVGAAPSFWE